MVNSCCAFGCTNRFVKNGGLGFFRFPPDPVRKKLWTLALRRKDFVPTSASRICGEHFQTGRPSRDSTHPDYVPNIFIFKHSKRRRLNIKQEESSENTVNDCSVIEMDVKTFSLYNSSQTEELTEMEEEMLRETTQQKECTVIKLKREENVSRNEDELLILKLELNQAYSDINTLTAQKDVLVKELSDSSLSQSVLQTSISEKEAELMKLKKELQQAYTEISALRTEKEELQKKLTAADVTQGILEDPGKLHFYTGLNSAKDFQTILSLLSDVDNSVKSVNLETQVLIVLTKLKLNLLYTDLAYRFQTSSKTVHRICDIIIPPLKSKIDLLVKCPINSALKKNIPVCYKNTAYENLYQRLKRNSKSKTKHSENEDTDTDSV